MKTGSCYLCGGAASTKDHVPPKMLFPPPRPSNLITLACCSACNGAYSKDEEYFRNNLAMISDYKNAREVWEATRRSYRRVPRILEGMMARMSPVRVGTNTFSRLTFDAKRTNRVLAKITRGLIYHHTGSRIPDSVVIDAFLPQDLPGIENYLSVMRWKGRWGTTFSYLGTMANDEPSVGFWLLNFYVSRVFFVSLRVF